MIMITYAADKNFTGTCVMVPFISLVTFITKLCENGHIVLHLDRSTIPLES